MARAPGARLGDGGEEAALGVQAPPLPEGAQGAKGGQGGEGVDDVWRQTVGGGARV